MVIRPLAWQRIVWVVLAAMTLSTLVVLFFIIGFITSKGAHVITPEFLFGMPERMGKEGGILPTIVATIYISLLAIVIATPIGVGSAVYLTEYTRESALTKVIRFGADALAGVPSIIFGLFGFILFVIRLRMGWSLAAGGLTLAFMILPTIIRTSEEAIRAVPHNLREVSYSLGGAKSQTITRVVDAAGSLAAGRGSRSLLSGWSAARRARSAAARGTSPPQSCGFRSSRVRNWWSRTGPCPYPPRHASRSRRWRLSCSTESRRKSATCRAASHWRLRESRARLREAVLPRMGA